MVHTADKHVRYGFAVASGAATIVPLAKASLNITGPLVDGALAKGATSVDIDAVELFGSIRAGESFLINGEPHSADAAVDASSNAATIDITTNPMLQAAPDNAPCVFTRREILLGSVSLVVAIAGVLWISKNKSGAASPTDIIGSSTTGMTALAGIPQAWALSAWGLAALEPGWDLTLESSAAVGAIFGHASFTERTIDE